MRPDKYCHVFQEREDMSEHNISDSTRKLTALENELALTVQELANTYEELSAIYRFSESFGTENNLEVLCKKIAKELQETFETSNVSIMLIDPERRNLVMVANEGPHSEEDHLLKLSEGHGIPWQVIETKRPLILWDMPDPDEPGASWHTTSFMAAPLIANRETLGVICLSDKIDGGEFYSNDLKLLSAVSNHAAIAIHNALVYLERERVFITMVRSFAAALDAKSTWTAGHSERVTKYSVAIAQEMGEQKQFLEELWTCGMLHDLGKINVPDHVLDKQDRITVKEYETIIQHTMKGAQILEPISRFEGILPGIKHHHERWDGYGMPGGLAGERIPLMARVLAVADSYDAMTSNRPYRRSREKTDAVEEIKRCAGSQFDPTIVKAFLRAVEKQVI
jgi:putative nucleotidyltransferase with HDIG domain